MINTLNLKDLGMQSISSEELIDISGGHDGTSYKIGQTLGKTIKVAATIFGCLVIFFMPKS